MGSTVTAFVGCGIVGAEGVDVVEMIVDSVEKTLASMDGDSIRGVRHSGRRGRLRRAAELAHHTIPARMDALVVGALKSQQGRSKMVGAINVMRRHSR